jgi:hypothetical protein
VATGTSAVGVAQQERLTAKALHDVQEILENWGRSSEAKGDESLDNHAWVGQLTEFGPLAGEKPAGSRERWSADRHLSGGP